MCFGRAKSFSFSVSIKSFFEKFLNDNTVKPNNIKIKAKAVSYTHLDVYKRQSTSRRFIRCIVFKFLFRKIGRKVDEVIRFTCAFGK